MVKRIFTFPEKAEKVRISYQRLNLATNPFPRQGLASRGTPFVPYPKKVIHDINTFVTDAVGSGGYHGLPIVGDYGSGKTRLFFAIEKEVAEGIEGCNAVYIDEPPADIQLFYEKVLGKTDLDSILKGLSLRFEKEIESIILKHLARVPSLLREQKYFLKGKGMGLVEEVSNFLLNLLGFTKAKDVRRAYAILLVDYFISNIVNAGNKMKISLVNSVISASSSARQYIAGNKVPKDLDQLMNFTDKKIKKMDICGEVFGLFVNICKIAGNRLLFILIDEFEEIIEKKTNRTIVGFLNDLRSLINNNVTSDFAIVLSCTPEAWIKANHLSPGFGERFINPTEMPPLDLESAEKIIAAYLYSQRIKKTSKEDITPFEKAAIKHILKMSDYKIREFIKKSNIILASLASSEESTVDLDFVDRALKPPGS